MVLNWLNKQPSFILIPLEEFYLQAQQQLYVDLQNLHLHFYHHNPRTVQEANQLQDMRQLSILFLLVMPHDVYHPKVVVILGFSWHHHDVFVVDPNFLIKDLPLTKDYIYSLLLFYLMNLNQFLSIYVP